ncbi:MAG: fibronectin type III domain-containing protein [Chitinophagales bacterium]|nr:fibronectin type III domain-containing protein [Chitinophagales bacterium]
MLPKSLLWLTIFISWTAMTSAQGIRQKLEMLEGQISLQTTELADYAPTLYSKAEKSVGGLRKSFDTSGNFSDQDYNKAKADYEALKLVADKAKINLGKAKSLHESILKSNLARAIDPKLFQKAENSYREALSFGEKQQFDKQKLAAKRAEIDYKALLKKAQDQLKMELGPELNVAQAGATADLTLMNGNLLDPKILPAVDGMVARMRPNRALQGSVYGFPLFAFDDPYFPPLPPPKGPTPPVVAAIVSRTNNSMSINWHDRSDDETGNRILRTTDLLNWTNISERGILPKFALQNYTDNNLTANTRYCYQIESYNNEGARRSQLRCAYTKAGYSIPIWRLQLVVKVANLENAGSDDEFGISLEGLTWTYTYMDYARQNLNKNTTCSFDLNLNHVEDINDISNFMLQKIGGDKLLIESFCLLANNAGTRDTLFSQYFGRTNATALNLGSYTVSHEELWGTENWNTFVQASLNSNIHNVPSVEFSNGQIQVVIKKAELLSRLEARIGHELHVDPRLRGCIVWGKLFGEGVEMTRKNNNTFSVDLDLKAVIDYFFDQEVDVDFELSFEKECDSNGDLVLKLNSYNYKTNWDDSKLLELLNIDTPDLPEIEQEIVFNLPEDVSCDNLQVSLNANGDLVICCFPINFGNN